jgi:hypothetical protein
MKPMFPVIKKSIVFLTATLFVFPLQSFQQNDGVEAFKPVQNKAFRMGERLVYRVHYGIIDAGEAVLEVKQEEKVLGGRPTYHVVGRGYSTGAFDWFFKVRDRYESYIDREALVPIVFIRDVDEGGYKIYQTHYYNHYKNEVKSNDKIFEVPPGVQDMISGFYFTRNIDFSEAKAGDVFTVPSFVDDQIWPLKIRYIGKEKLKTSLGTFQCLKFRPVIQKGRVFKKEEDLNVWITDDKNKIPVRAEAEILVGSIKMDLKSYEGLANPIAKIK